LLFARRAVALDLGVLVDVARVQQERLVLEFNGFAALALLEAVIALGLEVLALADVLHGAFQLLE